MFPSAETGWTDWLTTFVCFGIIIEAGGSLAITLGSYFGFSADVTFEVSDRSLHSSINGYRARPILVRLSSLPFLVIVRLCFIAVWRKPNFFTSESSSYISNSNGVYSLGAGFSISNSIICYADARAWWFELDLLLAARDSIWLEGWVLL